MKKILILIVLIAAVLRFYNLGTNPPSLTWDEAAWGYNSYSLGIDGKDEFGRFLPHDYMESFGDFKPTMYAYLGIIPVKIFGLNEFSTRFPSASFGTLTVLITYFLTKRLFFNYKLKEYTALAAAFMLAISPWHIMLSRAAFEANIATLFIILGVWLFLISIERNSTFLILSVISFILSIYTFNSARVAAPLLLIILSLVNFKKLLKDKKILVISVLVGFLLILPTAKFLLSPQASLRFKEVNIFSDIELIKVNNQEIANDGSNVLSKFIHNRRFVYVREFLSHYFDNLNPDFLFIKGDGNPKFATGDTGQMYIWEFPFFVAGLIFVTKNKGKNWWIVPAWLFIGIIPAAFARETPHALRIEGTLPTWQIFTAVGLVIFISSIKKYKKLAVGILSFIILINFAYFWHGYFVHYPKEFSSEWQYGYKESISYVENQKQQYDRIYFTNYLGRAYIYKLFYTQSDPETFREQSKVTRDGFGFVHVDRIEKYSIMDNLPNKVAKREKALYINDPSKVPQNAKIVKTFYQLNGKAVFTAYTL